MRNRWVPVLLVTATLLVAHSPAALAQDNCQTLKAMTQATIVLDPATLPPSLAAFWADYPEGWGGEVRALIGSPGANAVANIEKLEGWFYGRDAAGDAIYTMWNGRGRDGYYKFVFGTFDGTNWNITDTFTFQMGQAVWTPNPSGFGRLGSYQAEGTLVDGTGRFEGATGSLTLHGDFLYAGLHFNVWQPELTGTFCK